MRNVSRWAWRKSLAVASRTSNSLAKSRWTADHDPRLATPTPDARKTEAWYTQHMSKTFEETPGFQRLKQAMGRVVNLPKEETQQIREAVKPPKRETRKRK